VNRFLILFTYGWLWRQQTSELKRLIVSTYLIYPNQLGIKTRNTIGMILVNLLLSVTIYNLSPKDVTITFNLILAVYFWLQELISNIETLTIVYVSIIAIIEPRDIEFRRVINYQ
jgi:hypothetical protein